MGVRSRLAWALVPLTLTMAACTHRLPPSQIHVDGTQDVLVLVFNKASTPVGEAAIYLDDVCVARETYSPWAAGVEPPRIRLRLAPGVHRLRAEFGGASAVAEVSIDADGGNLDACGMNVWSITYRDKSLELGWTTVPAGVQIERIRPC